MTLPIDSKVIVVICNFCCNLNTKGYICAKNTSSVKDWKWNTPYEILNALDIDFWLQDYSSDIFLSV